MDASIAQKVLEKDRTRNINHINFLRSYPANSVTIVGDSVMTRGRSDEDWVYISSRSESELLQLKTYLDKEDKCFAILEDWMLPHIVAGRPIRSKLSSVKLVYEGKVAPQPAPQTAGKTASTLETDDSCYLYENSKYKEFIDVNYIRERIEKGVGLGIREDGRLVAWALTHDDGAIGFLNVLDDYRRMGYGMDVVNAMIHRLLEKGETPFVHIEPDNKSSLNLAKKAGFQEIGLVHWIKLKD